MTDRLPPGAPVEGFSPPPHPKGTRLEGASVTIEPLDADAHAAELFAANQHDPDDQNWTYLPYGPFTTEADYRAWVEEVSAQPDPCFFAIHSKRHGQAVGVASYLRIVPTHGVIEVGHIHFSPLLQATREATEAMFLMADRVFAQGYRRYEWKCNALNIRSRRAAARLGFSYEGVFRQMMIAKGRNRDTAWFAMIDQDWPAIKTCFDTYLSDDNFTPDGRARTSLSALTRPLLYQIDPLHDSGEHRGIGL